MTMTHRMTSLLTLLGPVYRVPIQWKDIGRSKRDMVNRASKLEAPVLSLRKSKIVLHDDLLTCTIFRANGKSKINYQQLEVRPSYQTLRTLTIISKDL